MKSSEELRAVLRAIDHKSYPAYKSLAGSYSFGTYVLCIEHVQGDPFAAPSSVSVRVDHQTAGFLPEYYETKENRTALEDFLLRRFGKCAERFSFQAKGSGKSGILVVSRPGQEVLCRTACEITKDGVIVRFGVGFPANGRTINARELEKILFEFLPACTTQSLLYRNMPEGEVRQAIFLAEDQQFIREELVRLGLVAFVADGAVLPRESGNSDRPMKGAVVFEAPESMAVRLTLPHKGSVRGMGIAKGITLIAGGGYHGKSTLLKALERGVYNHIAGDGREYVITDDSAVKIRAEDGRKVTHTDISLFINGLPSGRNTTDFSTLDASGSTSQAANVIEGIESGSRLLLIDEDTSATNFMVRDELMRQVVSGEKETITPFLSRVRDLYEKAGISMILVVGSCGEYFYVADQVLQMEAYRALDISDRVREVLVGRRVPEITAPGFGLPKGKRPYALSGAKQSRKNYRGDGYTQERLKIKRMGKTAFSVGGEDTDLRYLEQLVDGEQTETLAYLVRYAREQEGQGSDLAGLADGLMQLLERKGLAGICGEGHVPSGLAMPRRQEVFACFNRL